MYCVGIREHVMIAHSFRGETFGPAQRLHGATYVVDVELRRASLDADNVVVDIARAHDVLRDVLGKLAFQNLDDLPEFAGVNTTTEFLARFVWSRVAESARAGALGPSGKSLSSIRVTLHESHVAWASFEQELGHD
jgi:6-pyruvoyl-tetrahydropterin synthase